MGEVGRVRRRKTVGRDSGELDVFNEFLEAIGRRLKAVPPGETLITKDRRLEVISGSELDEFLKYCRDAKMIGIDVRDLLSLIRGDMDHIGLCFRKNSVEVSVSWRRYIYSRELTVTFKTPKITRNFTIFKEEAIY